MHHSVRSAGVTLLVALLLVLAIYFRLEEATRGYYTGPLRIGLSGALVALCAGVWFLW